MKYSLLRANVETEIEMRSEQSVVTIPGQRVAQAVQKR
jgi:hypothetical protein